MPHPDPESCYRAVKSRDRRFHAEYDAETKLETLSGKELPA